MIAIISGAKEAVLDGERLVCDNSKYMCCPTSMPVKAGTPTAAPDNPFFGVIISLDQRVMNELTLEMENVRGSNRADVEDAQGIRLAAWDDGFTDALSRLLKLGGDETDTAVLSAVRLRELNYAILKGEAGYFARRAFGAGNAIARSIAYVSSNLDTAVSINAMAGRAHMSRAVFHRKFKQATTRCRRSSS